MNSKHIDCGHHTPLPYQRAQQFNRAKTHPRPLAKECAGAISDPEENYRRERQLPVSSSAVSCCLKMEGGPLKTARPSTSPWGQSCNQEDSAWPPRSMYLQTLKGSKCGQRSTISRETNRTGNFGDLLLQKQNTYFYFDQTYHIGF